MTQSMCSAHTLSVPFLSETVVSRRAARVSSGKVALARRTLAWSLMSYSQFRIPSMRNSPHTLSTRPGALRIHLYGGL